MDNEVLNREGIMSASYSQIVQEEKMCVHGESNKRANRDKTLITRESG